jgi:GNAT superfamily N-acetyltransferase
VPAAATYELRQRLLRPHQTVEELQRRDDAGAEYFAALTDDDTVIATASVRRESCPWQPQRTDSWRLRGMATEPAFRGQGLGRQVLDAALAHIALSGGGLV